MKKTYQVSIGVTLELHLYHLIYVMKGISQIDKEQSPKLSLIKFL